MSEIKMEKVWPEWVLTGKLGTGDFADVYLAKSVLEGDDVYAAVKVINMPPSADAIDNARQSGIPDDLLKTYFGKFKNDLMWELTMYRPLSGDGLAPVDAVSAMDNENVGWQGYIRTPLYTPLATYFEKIPAGQEDAARMGSELCAALERCEKQNVVHGEIKPENVMVADSGAFVLVDFGVRRCLEKAGAGIFGEHDGAFEAPEVGEDKRYSASSDIYSLGMMMSYVAAGCMLPPNGDPDFIEGIDPNLAAVIKKATAKDPAERYASAAEMRAAVLKLPLGKKAPRRAMAAVAAIDAVKKNGGTIITSEEVAAAAAAARAARNRADGKNDDAAAKETPKKKKSGLAIVIIALLVIIAAIAAFAIGGQDADKPDDADKPPVTDNDDGVSDGAENPPVDDTVDDANDTADVDGENNTDAGTPDDGAQPDDVVQPDDGADEGFDDNTDTEPEPVTPPEDEPDDTPVGGNTGATNNDVLFPSDTKLITYEDMEGMNRSETYMLLNEIYARHGKIFETKSIQEYFESQVWYKPVSTSSAAAEAKFNATEKTNMRTIVDFQTEKGYRGDSSATTPDNSGTTTPDTGTTTPERPTPTNNDILFPSDTKLITAADLAGKSRSETYMLINEIYARHGKMFDTQSVQDYFNSQIWYTPVSKNYSQAEAKFNSTEWANINTIIDFQTQMGYRS